jgi:hypothetical protein
MERAKKLELAVMGNAQTPGTARAGFAFLAKRATRVCLLGQAIDQLVVGELRQ